MKKTEEYKQLSKEEKKWVDKLSAVFRKHKHIGSLRMVELLCIAYEEEIGYGLPQKKTLVSSISKTEKEG